ncbi:hypothetical protein [Undibacterium sp. TS12]|uniref:hypothetical protein n=1 Tax=Undibacterium sp. TS12 TaxID=2908202 RepID=UPI001F4CBB17|nr:hypothetical protein [Undibacterium sp. TS12]MCH8621286.1 hypothetical protein [Undibacterium sp. TS12]
MALPVLAGMAARYIGTKVVEHGIEKLATKGIESVLSSGALKEGMGKLDLAGKMDMPFSPSKMLMSSVMEPPVKSLMKSAAPAMK